MIFILRRYAVTRSISEPRKAAWRMFKNLSLVSWQELYSSGDWQPHIEEIRNMLRDGVLIADMRYVRVSQGNANWAVAE